MIGMAALTFLVAGSISPLFARPQYLEQFGQKYGTDNRMFTEYSCNICHVNGGGIGWNPYGKAIFDLFEVSPIPFEDFESIDSDGDGMTTGQEIMSDDPAVHPGRTAVGPMVGYLIGQALDSPTLIDADPETIITGETNGDAIFDCADIIETQKPTDRNFGDITDGQKEAIDRFLNPGTYSYSDPWTVKQ